MKRLTHVIATMAALSSFLAACAAPAAPVQAPSSPTAAPAASGTSSNNGNLDGVKKYLQNYGAQMKSNAEGLQTETKTYYEAVKAANFDYAKAWGDGATLRPVLLKMREYWTNADNSYENVEGIVAGVPSLARFDVLLDSGRSEGDNVAEFTLKLPDGKEVKNPGSFYNWLLEPQLFGTKAEWIGAKDIDVDGDGKTGFGDALPEANLIMGSADGLVQYTNEAVAAINAWQPSEQDAFQALVTMTPTMDEYFGNWKDSRFVSGDAAADQQAFVAKTRLEDVSRIVESIKTIYSGVHPTISGKNAELAKQIEKGYADLDALVKETLTKEKSGAKFTPAQAETLGKEAQDRAQALAGQVAQAAALVGIKVEQ